MCRASARDVFPELFQPSGTRGGTSPITPTTLWSHIIESDRVAYAPKNEMMSDDEEV